MSTKINSIKCKPTLKIYRTDGAQTAWEKRLDAIGSGTYLLHEEMDYSRNRALPKIGNRLGESKCFADGEVYHRQSDWLVAKIQSYPAVGEDCDWDQIILCYCQLVINGSRLLQNFRSFVACGTAEIIRPSILLTHK